MQIKFEEMNVENQDLDVGPDLSFEQIQSDDSSLDSQLDSQILGSEEFIDIEGLDEDEQVLEEVQSYSSSKSETTSEELDELIDIESLEDEQILQEVKELSMRENNQVREEKSFDFEEDKSNPFEQVFENISNDVAMEKAEAIQDTPVKTPSKIIKLGFLKDNTESKDPRFNQSLDTLKNHEFFENSWCYKEDNHFNFRIDGFNIHKNSFPKVMTGRSGGQHAETRVINFDDEFAGWFLNINGRVKLTGCHIRVDKELANRAEYHFKSPFHVTLEFEGGSCHLRFDETGRVINADFAKMRALNKDVIGLAYELAQQFVHQIEVRAPAAKAAPKMAVSPYMNHTFHGSSYKKAQQNTPRKPPTYTKDAHKYSFGPHVDRYSLHHDKFGKYKEKALEEKSKNIHDARNNKFNNKKGNYGSRY